MKRRTGMTLLEVIVATLILFIVLCVTFQIITSAYAHMTKMKCMGRLIVVTQSKMESFLFNPPLNSTSTWEKFSSQSEYVYTVDVSTVTASGSIAHYSVKKITVTAKGPEGRNNVPEFTFSLSTYVLNEEQSITFTGEKSWGEGLSPEVNTP